MRSPFAWSNLGGTLLTPPGVEWAIVGGITILKSMNLIQMFATVALAGDVPRHPQIQWIAASLFAASGVMVLIASIRVQRIWMPGVVVDVAVAIGVLLCAPIFQPRGAGVPWIEWPLAMTLLVGAEACTGRRLLPGLLGTLAVMGACATWLLYEPPPLTAHNVLINNVPYLGFALGWHLFINYIRNLAAVAELRAEQIRTLEEERLRRILHTPYRLLHDLTEILRADAGAPGTQAQRKAQLAEAVASLREIESVVRGTEPASGQLAAELLRLREQFADLPLITDVDGVQAELPPAAVYRIREAARSALQNVRLHAHAHEVVLFAEADTQRWLVSIQDDGRGFDPSGRRGVGIDELIVAAMTEIGAQVRIDSNHSEGTIIELTGDVACQTGPGASSSSTTTPQ